MKESRICLWSGPRNVSTALMYAFAQRTDTTVVDEPLYAYYLHRSGANHPGRAEILAAQSVDGEEVIHDLLGSQTKPVRFFKQMAHHITGLNRDFLGQVKNVLLIRDPWEILLSYSKVIENPTLADVGLDVQGELLTSLEAKGQLTAVLDSKEILLNPKAVLQQLCERLEIPFQEEMLHWAPGPIEEDGIWAPYWYASVHQSSGFAAYRPREEKLPGHLLPVYEAALPIYNELFKRAIRAH